MVTITMQNADARYQLSTGDVVVMDSRNDRTHGQNDLHAHRLFGRGPSRLPAFGKPCPGTRKRGELNRRRSEIVSTAGPAPAALPPAVWATLALSGASQPAGRERKVVTRRIEAGIC